MGVYTTIIREWLALISPGSIIPYDSTYVPPQAAMVPFDFTSLLYKMQKSAPEHRNMMTGLELRQVFMNKLVNLASRKHKRFARGVVVCIDRRDRVPKEKALEQLSRIEASTVEPYPEDVEFCHQGIRLPNGKIELLDTNRLAKSSKLRTAMCDYLKDAVDDSCGTVLMDCWDTPLWLGKHDPICDEPLPTHRFGEADLQLMFWAQHFRNHPIVHITIDGDEIPIAMSHMLTNGPPLKEWHWIQHWSPTIDKTQKVVDLKRFYQDLTALKMPIRASLDASPKSKKKPKAKPTFVIEYEINPSTRIELFIIFTMLFKTDYVRSKEWTHFAKGDQVWKALYRSEDEISRMIRMWKVNEVLEERSKDWLEFSIKVMTYVTRQIMHVFSGERDQMYPDFDGWKSKKAPPPLKDLLELNKLSGKRCPHMPENMELAVTQLRFNFMYWRNQFDF